MSGSEATTGLRAFDRVWVVVLGCGEDMGRCRGEAATCLHRALSRAGRLVAPHRVVPVVPEIRRDRWQAELARLSGENIVSEPEDKGTAIAVLAGLVRVLSRQGPAARLLILSSDLEVSDEDMLHSSLRAAIPEARDRRLVLLRDAEPGPRTSERPQRGAQVRPAAARLILSCSAFAAMAETLVHLYAKNLPGLISAFMTGLHPREAWEPDAMRRLYRGLPRRDFTRDVLESSPIELLVMPLEDHTRSHIRVRSQAHSTERVVQLQSLRSAQHEAEEGRT